MRGDHDNWSERQNNRRRNRGRPSGLTGKPSGRPLGREVLEYAVGIAFWILMISMIV